MRLKNGGAEKLGKPGSHLMESAIPIMPLTSMSYDLEVEFD